MTVLKAYLGIAYESPEEKVLRLLVEMAAQFAGASEGSLLVLDEENNELVFAMTVGSEESEGALKGQRVPLGEGITGLAAQTHEVQIGAPTYQVDQADGVYDDSQPNSVLAAPMLIDDRLIGVLTAVSFDKSKRFSAKDARLYGRVAQVAGVVVEQRRRINAISAIQKGESLPGAVNEDERLESEIIDRVMRLIRKGPDMKTHLARLLAAVEAMMEG